MTKTSFNQTSSTLSMIRRGLSVLVIGGAIVGAALAGSTGAQAHGVGGHGGGHFGHGGHGFGHGWGRGAGIGLGLGLLGAVAYDAYDAPRVCRWERQFDDDGNYLGRARVCRTW